MAITDGDHKSPWIIRLGWLGLIWCVSVAALAGVALLIRVVMRAIGMTT